MSSFQERHTDAVEPPAPDNHAQVDALRFWLTSGLHKFGVDPRRRLGVHRRARELLTQDRKPASGSSEAWQALAATLDRHTVLGGMTELSPEERSVIMLAYLEGRSNSEIAAALEVSVGTVGRRLRAALKQIDKYLTRTGTWALAIVLLGAGYVAAATARLGRYADAIGSAEWSHTLASTAAVSVLTAAAIGVAAISPDSANPRNPSTPATVHVVAAPSSADVDVSPVQRTGPAAPPGTIVVTSDRSHGLGTVVSASVTSIQHQATKVHHANNGCGGKPTNAPPPVPVGRHSGGPPISHPGKGGCHA